MFYSSDCRLVTQLHPLLLLVQSQIHYPASDLSPVSAALDSLGHELKARLKESGVPPLRGGVKALEVLNHLLFGDPAPSGTEDDDHLPGSRMRGGIMAGADGGTSGWGTEGYEPPLTMRLFERCTLDRDGGSGSVRPWNIGVVPPRGFGLGLRVGYIGNFTVRSLMV
jgi:hypothetical protein